MGIVLGVWVNIHILNTCYIGGHFENSQNFEILHILKISHISEAVRGRAKRTNI